MKAGFLAQCKTKIQNGLRLFETAGDGSLKTSDMMERFFCFSYNAFS